ncbi:MULTISPECIES: hypothetical protein [unclassified Pseudoalteromonas]|uniref:hypothetical protein n=1 Tax=unclassified Pseudoalteromonas TaxID=194690 RepID=UPI001107D277|nr:MULTISPECIES: hypothetical protein [unclassified Pseudoalteromonas]MCO7251388.1 hypothetical protein [Pseudoalteromonas sp. Ps84H-4]TMO43142.1 hypothetical protein CWC25_13115 [Pseudoalteromonas sp. S4389]
MKSLLGVSNLIPNRKYWCSYSIHSELNLMLYQGNGLFQYKALTLVIDDIKVMFKGNKPTIPSSELVKGKLYWCHYSSDNVLELMRYQGQGLVYLVGKDHDTLLSKVKVAFESL